MMRFHRFVIMILIVIAFPLSAFSATFTTYAAWPDPGNICTGYIHLYTTQPNTTYTLYEADGPGQTISNPVPGHTAVFVPDAYTPLPEYGPFCTKYFMGVSDQPIVWDV